MPSFAEGTSVPVAKSIADLQALAEKHGASGWVYARDGRRERILFVLEQRPITFDVLIPDPAEKPYRVRAQEKTWVAAEHRRRWRCVYLLVKALFVAVEDRVLTLHEAFLPHTLLPSGETVAAWAGAQPEIWTERTMPSLLPGAPRAALES